MSSVHLDISMLSHQSNRKLWALDLTPAHGLTGGQSNGTDHGVWTAKTHEQVAGK